MTTPASVELLWIPLGAGASVVRLSGRAYEALMALLQRRARCDLYHSALVVRAPDARYVVEMAPVADADGAARGAVRQGAVGSRLLGRWRVFRYEVRRWRDGVIPDEPFARCVSRLDVDLDQAQRLLELADAVPTPVWGRDELRTGEMWNSNSVTSWLLHSAGFDLDRFDRPAGGRAPGWDAGLVVARRAGGEAR